MIEAVFWFFAVVAVIAALACILQRNPVAAALCLVQVMFCLAAIFEACKRLKDRDWMKKCEVWLYRGAWQEWGVDEIEMAVPLSPDEVSRKRIAIFKHESQKDRAPFPGTDAREFWQRAEDRNRATAKAYDKLGLAEYEAIEGFVLWKPAAIN